VTTTRTPRKGVKGRLPGGHNRTTMDKIAAREAVRQIITASIEAMTRAQIQAALGIGHVYTRDKKGKFSRVTSEAHIDALVKTGSQGKDYFLFTKDPSTHAYTALMDRALDQAKQQKIELEVTDTTRLSDEELADRIAQLSPKLKRR